MKIINAPKFHPVASMPLSAEVKLTAINKWRLNNNLAQLASVPPPQITLTPKAPTLGGLNYLDVHADYHTQQGHEAIVLSPGDYVAITFQISDGKTYLLDVTGSGITRWNYELQVAGKITTSGEITPQQGHLLLPFIAASSSVIVVLSPAAGHFGGQFLSAQLTRVG